MNDQRKIVGPFTELVTMANMPLKGALSNSDLQIIRNGAIAINGSNIVELGSFDELVQKDTSGEYEVHKISGTRVALPGFIDAHTHICFAGSRANDFELRNAGSDYLEIARSGGGIWDTVRKTREASKEVLINGVLRRTHRLALNGITTCEVKSGYGLSIEQELKMLEAIKVANEQCEIDLVPTCLAAHIFPKDYNGGIEEYVKEIVLDLFPLLKGKGLTNRVDAFIEEEAFSEKVIRPYFEAAVNHGFDITVHADQFHTGGSKVAVDFNALSADHLEASTDKEIQMLANSDTIAMALPGASIGIGCPFTPARKLLDAGASLAIASDWNPGSAPMGDLLTQASILASFEKLTNAEVLAAITFRAAAALKLSDRGVLKPGCKADFVIFETDSYKEITYQQGQLKPLNVWKNGQSI